MAGCLVVPLTHPEEGVVGLYGRRISTKGEVRHLYLPGPHRGILNWQALKLSSEIIVAESVLDALSWWVAGFRNVTCIYGVQGLTAELQDLLGRYAVRQITFTLDGDEAGRGATERLSARLEGRGVRCRTVEIPEDKDPNELLVEGGAHALEALLGTARPVGVLDDSAGAEGSAAIEVTDDGFAVQFGDVAYRVAPRPPFGGRLRVMLRVVRRTNRFLDTIDLYSHRARSTAVTQICQRLELGREDVERHFLLLLEKAETWVEVQRAADGDDEGADKKAKRVEMTAAEREEALAFLRDPRLVELLLEDIEALGYVGEEKGKLLAYLIGLSRRLERPLSGIVLSQSGAGKSSMAEIVEVLTPAEDVVLYSRISAQALCYLPKDFLKRKLLILEERAGAEQADYSIRVLQSKSRLSSAVVIKDPTTGKMRTRHFAVEGPIAYIETTTNPKINNENATRCFEITLDESEAQTRRIHERQRQARTVEGLRNRQKIDGIRQRHHNAQRLLEPVRILIPYVGLLTFPSRWLRTRRDNERFLSLVEAAAFLHQHQREGGVMADGTRYIEAVLSDYALAYDLAREVLRSTLHELTREARELVAMIQAMLGGKTPSSQGPQFTRKDLRAHTDWQDHRLRAALDELVEMEYLGTVSGSQGRTYQYRLLCSGSEPPHLGELTTPEQLARLLGGDASSS
jgi:hypothetical protein